MLILRRLFSNHFSYGVYSIGGSHKKRNEDAYYVSKDIIAIADGVGGYDALEVDASKYPWQLMHSVEKFANELSGADRTSKNIVTQADLISKEFGNATLCITRLDQTSSIIDALNIGDSGFYIYRQIKNELKLVIENEMQSHRFNHPFQLGHYGDKVDEAWTKDIKVRNKDYVVMFTDGICDNLDEEMVRGAIKNNLENPDLNDVAKRIGEMALEKSLDKTYNSPFAKGYGGGFMGGKPDDITVIVAQVNIKQLE